MRNLESRTRGGKAGDRLQGTSPPTHTHTPSWGNGTLKDQGRDLSAVWIFAKVLSSLEEVFSSCCPSHGSSVKYWGRGHRSVVPIS